MLCGILVLVTFIACCGLTVLRFELALLTAIFSVAHPYLEHAIGAVFTLAGTLLKRSLGLRRLTASLLLLCLVTGAGAQSPVAPGVVARLVYIDGSVEFKRASSPPSRLTSANLSKLLYLGDRLRCQAPCRAGIRYSGLMEGTSLGLECSSCQPNPPCSNPATAC